MRVLTNTWITKPKLLQTANRLCFMCAMTSRKYHSIDSVKTLVHAFITCKLDWWNSLLNGLLQNFLQRLQMVQNCAAQRRESLTMSLLPRWIWTGFPSNNVLSSRFWLSPIDHQMVLSPFTSVIHWMDISQIDVLDLRVRTSWNDLSQTLLHWEIVLSLHARTGGAMMYHFT